MVAKPKVAMVSSNDLARVGTLPSPNCEDSCDTELEDRRVIELWEVELSQREFTLFG